MVRILLEIIGVKPISKLCECFVLHKSDLDLDGIWYSTGRSEQEWYENGRLMTIARWAQRTTNEYGRPVKIVFPSGIEQGYMPELV